MAQTRARATEAPSDPGAQHRTGARLLLFAPLLLAGVYVITLATQISRLVSADYLNADAASAPVIGELFGSRTDHAQVLLGHLGWYSTLLFELATKWLPLHRQIWEATPYALMLAAAALVAWGVLRLAGRWAGAISLAVLVCMGPTALTLLGVLNDHAPSWFTLALLGAVVVGLELEAHRMSRARLVPLVLVAGLVTGANAASDVLVTIAGAVPLLLALSATWALRPSRRTAIAAGAGLAVGVVALASGLLLHAWMHHQGVTPAADPHSNLFATGDAVGSNFKLWWQSIAVLGNGDFFGRSLGFSTALALACAGLAVAAVLLAPRLAAREVVAARLASSAASANDPEPESSGAERERRDARTAWCLYWASSAVLLSVAFIFSAIPEDITASRYLVGLIYAGAAVVPLVARTSPARIAVTIAASLYAFTGWLALAQQRIGPPASPTTGLASQVMRIARSEHLAVGYAGYWDASPITWASHLGVHVFPVIDCDGNQHLCGYELHLIASWYTPRPGARTFLLSDPAYPSVSSAPTPDLGPPAVVHQLGAVTMYVYPYDIAARLAAL